jgi:hypothetical protein
MPSEIELAIQQHIMRYLADKESLAEFQNWFVPILWDIDHEDAHTQELAGRVHLLISEVSRGDRSLQDLNRGLAGTVSHLLARDSAVQ